MLPSHSWGKGTILLLHSAQKKKRKMESNNRFSALCYEEDKGEEGEGEGEDSSLVKALTSLLED